MTKSLFFIIEPCQVTQIQNRNRAEIETVTWETKLEIRFWMSPNVLPHVINIIHRSISFRLYIIHRFIIVILYYTIVYYIVSSVIVESVIFSRFSYTK